MKLSEKVRIPQEVLARKVGGETVMLDLASGTYFGLDPIGTRIWELFGQGKTLAEVCDVMTSEYEVSHDDIKRDVLSLVEELSNRGLIGPA